MLKHLSKKDLVDLMETAFRTLEGRSRSDLEAVVGGLRRLVPFDRAMLANVSTRGGTTATWATDPEFAGLTFGIPEEFLKQYREQKQYLVDPIAEELLRSSEPLDYQEVERRRPAIFQSPLYRDFLREYDITRGCACSVRSRDFTRMSAVAFYYPRERTRTDRRVKAITKYIVPFIAEQYSRLLEQSVLPVESPLTPRELEVTRWLKDGKTAWEIGAILRISERTVNFHVANIKRKLNATKQTQAVAIAVGKRLIEF